MPPEELLQFRPNELGVVPIFMYHNIIPDDAPRDSSVDPFMYRTYDEFWGDMLWLYEHDFYLVGMNQLVSGNYDIPLGKHPVVFTFDDGTSLHMSATEDANGNLVVDPNCAVGIMERFYAEYPDFGRGAHFGLVPGNKFSWPANDQDDLFEKKVHWMIERNYEIGNHTMDHGDLSANDIETFAWTVSGPVIWADEFMGADHPMNASRILTLPFGIYPTEGDNPEKVDMIKNGFDYEGNHIQLRGVLRLNGGSSASVWSTEWDPYALPRIPVQDDPRDDTLGEFKNAVESSPDRYYSSDGNPDTVTVPWPLPESLVGTLNKDAVIASGKQLVKYDPRDGRIYPPSRQHRLAPIDIRRYIDGT